MCGPCILLDTFPLNGAIHFLLIEKNMIFRKDLGVATYFFFFLREKKIRKKTLSVAPYLEKIVYEKPKSGPRVRLPIRKVRC